MKPMIALTVTLMMSSFANAGASPFKIDFNSMVKDGLKKELQLRKQVKRETLRPTHAMRFQIQEPSLSVTGHSVETPEKVLKNKVDTLKIQFKKTVKL